MRFGANGVRTTYKVSLKGNWFPDGLRLLCEVTEPVAARMRILLHLTANGHITAEVAQAGKAVSALPQERWTEPVLGTDFSYDDMVEGQFFWKAQELEPPE